MRAECFDARTCACARRIIGHQGRSVFVGDSNFVGVQKKVHTCEQVGRVAHTERERENLGKRLPTTL